MFRKKIEEIEQDKRDKQIIDLRSPEEYEKETYPGAVNLFWEELDEHKDEIVDKLEAAGLRPRIVKVNI